MNRGDWSPEVRVNLTSPQATKSNDGYYFAANFAQAFEGLETRRLGSEISRNMLLAGFISAEVDYAMMFSEVTR